MENRVGFKDVFLFGLLILLIALVCLAMAQFDRQWETVQDIKKTLDQQQADLFQLRQAVRSGTPAPERNNLASAESCAPSAGTTDPFADLRKVYAAPDFACGDWYVGGMPTVVKKLTPLVATDWYSAIVANYVQETMAVRDPETLEWKPWIATKWTMSKDGLTIAFDLRPDASFSDGHPVTAEDVVFSYNQIQRSDINCQTYKPSYDKFLSCKAEGALRVVFRLKSPYFQAFDAAAGVPILAKHWYEKFSAEEFNTKPGLLFGSGPYKLEGDPLAWTPGSGQITLVRNPKYWGPKPPLDKLVWREYPDDSARLADFRNGKLDSYGVLPDLFPQLSRDAQLNERGHFLRRVQVDNGYSYIGWNESWGGKPSPFADKRVRQAMTLLTDRARILREIYNDIGQVASGPFSPATKQPDPTLKPMAFDPQQAAQLLKEAGWEVRDDSGVLKNAQGDAFRFKLTYPSGRALSDRTMLFLKDAYAKAGIVMTPDPLAFDILLERLEKRDFHACSLAWGGTVEDDPRQIFHTEAMKEGSNRIGYSNPQLDALIDTARSELDAAKRAELWHKAHRLLNEDQPFTFLFNDETVVFVDKRFQGYTLPKTGMTNWPGIYVPKALQMRK